jgi:PEGA domain
MKKLQVLVLVYCLLLPVPFTVAMGRKKDKAEPSMVMLWPNESSPTLRLTFDKFDQIASYAGQLSLESHVLVENLTSSPIPRASFTVYLMDGERVRIGNGTLNLTDLGAGQKVMVAFQVFSVGIPATLTLAARTDTSGIPTSLKTVPLKIISVPAGANLKVDGREEGVTPKVVYLAVGNHTLEFSKEGYATGSTPVDISLDEAPGGSITFQLGGLSRDEIELRDGTVLLGDVISLNMTAVVVRVGGKDQAYDRNQVRKIILVQRETVQQPPVVQPAFQQ